jgi:DDE superfamily endonuclease
MAQDEARFGRICEPHRCWAPPGIRPHTPQQAIRQAVYAFAAIAPQQGKMTMLILPTADTAMMNLFLRQVSQDFATFFVIMQVDQAGWHRSKDLQIPENIRLIFQPAYSPELNPVEHLWDELREKYFFNHAFSSLDALQEHLCLGLNELAAQPDLIRSMTLFPHFCISDKNAI